MQQMWVPQPCLGPVTQPSKIPPVLLTGTAPLSPGPFSGWLHFGAPGPDSGHLSVALAWGLWVLLSLMSCSSLRSFPLQSKADGRAGGTELDFIPSSGLGKRLCHGQCRGPCSVHARPMASGISGAKGVMGPPGGYLTPSQFQTLFGTFWCLGPQNCLPRWPEAHFLTQVSRQR